MKPSIFAGVQKTFTIEQGEEGATVAEICRKVGSRTMSMRPAELKAEGYHRGKVVLRNMSVGRDNSPN